jgi:hypothetical protein
MIAAATIEGFTGNDGRPEATGIPPGTAVAWVGRSPYLAPGPTAVARRGGGGWVRAASRIVARAPESFPTGPQPGLGAP